MKKIIFLILVSLLFLNLSFADLMAPYISKKKIDYDKTCFNDCLSEKSDNSYENRIDCVIYCSEKKDRQDLSGIDVVDTNIKIKNIEEVKKISYDKTIYTFLVVIVLIVWVSFYKRKNKKW